MADALLDELESGFTIACPAFPENGRTIYLGHLFVGGDLLSDSSMRNHPLTPMRDANLVRVLGRQTQHKVGLVPYKTVKQGAPAIAEAYAALEAQGIRHAIVDAVEDKDLENIGAASCRPAAHHRRIGRGDRPSGELPHGTAHPQARGRAGAGESGRPRHRALRLLLGGNAGPGRALRGQAPRHGHRPAGACTGAGEDRRACSSTGPRRS